MEPLFNPNWIGYRQSAELMKAQQATAESWLKNLYGEWPRIQHCPEVCCGKQTVYTSEYFPFCSWECKDWHEQITKT